MVRRTLGRAGGDARQSRRAPLAQKGFGLPLQVTISCPYAMLMGLQLRGSTVWIKQLSSDGPFTGPGGTHANRAEPPQAGRTPIVQSPPGPEGICHHCASEIVRSCKITSTHLYRHEQYHELVPVTKCTLIMG